MMTMKKLLLAAAFVIGAPALAHAQNVGNARVVQTCATQSYGAGINAPLTQDTTGAQCSNASFAGSVSISGFTPNGSVANLSVSTSSANVALPSGAVAAVSNSGSTAASIKLSIGAGSAATTDFQLPAGATVGLTVGSNTFINAITASSSTTLSIAGGTGLITGYGGGGSGSSGGNVTVVGPLGSAVSASSVSVVVASDQAAVAVKQATAANLNATVVGTGTFATQLTGATNNINNVAGTVSLPTGASTAAKQPALGTAGSASADVITVQGIASGTALGVSAASLPLPTGASTAALQPSNAAQGSTTSGQTGTLIQGAVTTAAPTYTTAQTSPLSLDTTGALRVNVTAGGGTGGTSSNFGSAFPTPGTAVGFKDSSGTNMAAGNLDASGFLKVNVAAGGGSGGTSSSFGAAVPATGTAMGASDGTNMIMPKVDSAANLKTVGGYAQASTTSGQTVMAVGCRTLTSAPTDTTAQTNIPSCDTAGALRVNVTSATGVAQASTTSGQTISPIGCRTLTSAPTDTTAQTNMPSCTTAGALRVTDAGAATSALALETGGNLATLAGAITSSVVQSNTKQINGVTVLMGNGTTGTGSQRVTIASDTSANALWGQAATGAAVPANAVYAGAVSAGNLTGIIQADSSVAISIATGTTTQLVALSSGKKIYVTSWDVVSAGTGNITLEYGTGSNCGTGTTVLTGAYNLTAQSGLTKGNGLGPVLVVPASNALCALTTASVQMSGSVSYTQF